MPLQKAAQKPELQKEKPVQIQVLLLMQV